MQWMDLIGELRYVWALAALAGTALTVVLLRRMRGALQWGRSLKAEVRQLERVMETADPAKRRALEVVVDTCKGYLNAPVPKVSEVMDLQAYVHAIASCFHPDLEMPELRITTGGVLTSIRQMANRLDLILNRKGFGRLGRIRVHHLRKAYERYERFSRFRVVRVLFARRVALGRILASRFILLPDPFSLIACLSNRLTLMALTRFLLVDVYLFAGKLAVHVYDEETNGEESFEGTEGLGEALEELDTLSGGDTCLKDERIRLIRRRLVGPATLLTSPRGVKQWVGAVRESAELIARAHFPGSKRPLEEVTVEALLTRGRVWLASVADTEKIPLIHTLHRVRLDSLSRVKAFGEHELVGTVREAARNAWGVYHHTRWPVKVAGWVARRSPVKMAMDLALVAAKRGIVNFMYRYTFDRACRELDLLYGRSLSKEDRDGRAGVPVAAVSEPHRGRDA